MRKMFCSALFAAISATSYAHAETLEFTAGGVGGGWYNMASGLSALVQEKESGLSLKTVPGGGVSNPSKINKGVSQLGFIQSIFGVAAKKGSGPFKGKPHTEIRMVLHGLADNYLHLVKAKDDKAGFSDIFTSGSRKIGVAKAGSTDEYSFRFVMEHYGTSYDKLRSAGKVVNAGYLDLASAFKDGQIDYIFVLLGLPGSMVVDASQGRDTALVPFGSKLRDDLSATWGYAKKAIPAGTYAANKDADVPVLVTSTSLYASSKVSDDTIYKIVKAICENTDRLGTIAASMENFSCRNAAGDGAVPLHPGAAKYLKEKGYI